MIADEHDTTEPAPTSPERQGRPRLSLEPPGRWHDPLGLIREAAPARSGRIVLWTISVLILLLLLWAAYGELDITVTAEGRLEPQTLVKIVQPAEAGVLKELLVNEGDIVRKGQTLARLDMTLAKADMTGISTERATLALQMRRVEAELDEKPFRVEAGDEPLRFAEVYRRFEANQQTFRNSLEQEMSLLRKVEQEMHSAMEIERKLEQTLPSYRRTAEAFANMATEGFVSALAADEKRRELTEKEKDLAAQTATVQAAVANLHAQQQKVQQVKSLHKSDLQRELAELRSRIEQLQPDLEKARYRETLMELKAPQDGVIVDLATTTMGAVLKPGDVLLTLVPQGELLYANVQVRHEDVGFIAPNQPVQIKLSAFPFQKYGLLEGMVLQVGADVSTGQFPAAATSASGANPAERNSAYKATIALSQQFLAGPSGAVLPLRPGMQLTAEIHQGKRTVLDYLLSPLKKVAQEAGRER